MDHLTPGQRLGAAVVCLAYGLNGDVPPEVAMKTALDLLAPFVVDDEPKAS